MQSIPSNDRQQRGRATRAGILDVARQLFSDFGYHHTGIADIQAATGLTKGAFYHHFRAKQELALGVIEMAREDYREHWLEPAMAASTPGKRLSALLDGFVVLENRPEWLNFRLLATLSAEVTAGDGPLADAVREMQERTTATFAQLISEAQQTQEAVPIDPQAAAQWVCCTLVGHLLARKLGVAHADSSEVIGLLSRFLLAPPAP